MKWLIGLTLCFSVSVAADRLEDEARVVEAFRQVEESGVKVSDYDPTEFGSLDDLVARKNQFYELLELNNLSWARFYSELGTFIKNFNYIPAGTSLDSRLRDEYGAVDFYYLERRLLSSKIFCTRALIQDGEMRTGYVKCPSNYRKLERNNKRLAEHFGKLAKEAESPAFKNDLTSPAPQTYPFEDLGRGYKRRLSGAGVLTIERAYPNSKNPKMILIGYEGLDKLEKDAVVPLVFSYGDENRSLKFQIGHEIPEDEVTKGRRILSLQIIRFKKKPKEKPDVLSNKELAAIEDFIKQFNGKEISDQNNIILTEIYPDPDNTKQQIAASWRAPLKPKASLTDLGYQGVESLGVNK